MKILLLNQCFYPDTAATAQHATDLARELARQGHDVTVVASCTGYGQPEVRYPSEEAFEGVGILRVGSIDLGKDSRWRRALNFGSFLAACGLRLATLGRFDRVVAMTSPPLISVLAALFTRLKGGQLHIWVMDLNPDEAIAAGWLREDRPLTRLLERLLHYSMIRAISIVVLDRYMKERIRAKGIAENKITVVPPGARTQFVRYDPKGRSEFRKELGVDGKFLVMYSGNHSPCHPLGTLLSAAKYLRDDPRVAFCFIGGGSQFDVVRQFVQANHLGNVVCLPYQPEERLSASLSAADLHAVVMGDPYVGIVHPSKIYNVLALGIPVLYIGPKRSHITDFIPPEAENKWFYPARHSEVQRVVDQIRAAQLTGRTERVHERTIAAQFKQSDLVKELCARLTGDLDPVSAVEIATNTLSASTSLCDSAPLR